MGSPTGMGQGGVGMRKRRWVQGLGWLLVFGGRLELECF